MSVLRTQDGCRPDVTVVASGLAFIVADKHDTRDSEAVETPCLRTKKVTVRICRPTETGAKTIFYATKRAKLPRKGLERRMLACLILFRTFSPQAPLFMLKSQILELPKYNVIFGIKNTVPGLQGGWACPQGAPHSHSNELISIGWLFASPPKDSPPGACASHASDTLRGR